MCSPISSIFRNDSRVARFRPLSLSFMSVAELYYGAHIARWGPARVGQLQDRLRKYVVLPYDYEVCRLWGDVHARRKAQGREIGPADACVAATALRFDCPLATNNGRSEVDS